MTITGSKFICKELSYNHNFPASYIQMQTDIDQGDSMSAGLFEFDSKLTGAITSTSNEYKRCYNTYEGSIFNIPEFIQLTDTGSLFEENGGENGIISVDSSTVTMYNSIIKNSESKHASFINMKNSATVLIQGLSMSYGKSRTKGGAFVI